MIESKRLYTTSEATAVAGCEIGTFQKWRKRNGLFPETIGAFGWNRLSVPQVAVVRMIVVLSKLGLSAQTSVAAAMEALPVFERASTVDTDAEVSELVGMDNIIVIDRDDGDSVSCLPANPNANLYETLLYTEDGAAVIVDALAVFDHVDLELQRRDDAHPSRPDPQKMPARSLSPYVAEKKRAKSHSVRPVKRRRKSARNK